MLTNNYETQDTLLTSVLMTILRKGSLLSRALLQLSRDLGDNHLLSKATNAVT